MTFLSQSLYFLAQPKPMCSHSANMDFLEAAALALKVCVCVFKGISTALSVWDIFPEAMNGDAGSLL